MSFKFQRLAISVTIWSFQIRTYHNAGKNSTTLRLSLFECEQDNNQLYVTFSGMFTKAKIVPKEETRVPLSQQ